MTKPKCSGRAESKKIYSFRTGVIQDCTHFEEGAHNENAHLHGLRTVEHRGHHDCAVFREGVGKKSSAAMP
jgi:hypothetical protein